MKHLPKIVLFTLSMTLNAYICLTLCLGISSGTIFFNLYGPYFRSKLFKKDQNNPEIEKWLQFNDYKNYKIRSSSSSWSIRSLWFILSFFLPTMTTSSFIITVMHFRVIIHITITMISIFLLWFYLIQYFLRTLYELP